MSDPTLLPPGRDPLEADWSAHLARHGALVASGDIVAVIERAQLRGRGGAGFPVARKWRGVREQGGRPIIVANGAEGEVLSHKDRTLMTRAPHLILDGVLVALRALDGERAIVCVGADHLAALAALRAALAQRQDQERRLITVRPVAVGYITGEETALVHHINAKVALPTGVRPFEHGVSGRPTLVQNVETLAQVALLARHGDDRARAPGLGGATGGMLLTISGAVGQPGVIEVPHGIGLPAALERVGGVAGRPQALLLGGYFGNWLEFDEAQRLTLDADALRQSGMTLGAGVIAVLGEAHCGVDTSARILAHMAGSSARQCGPCTFGLVAIAGAAARLAQRHAHADDLARLRSWAALVRGRGACHHPDGAAMLLDSALATFAEDFAAHQQGRCVVSADAHAAAVAVA